MRNTLPVSYVRVWTQKNQTNVTFKTKAGDTYEVNASGVWLPVPNERPVKINPRLVFRVVNRYPSLHSSELIQASEVRPVFLSARKPEDKAPKFITFDEIADEVERYLSLLSGIEETSFYVAVRAYESGLVGLPQLNRIATTMEDKTSLGTIMLQQRMCNWEDLLAVCLDLDCPDRTKSPTAPPRSGEFELCGEILVSLRKINRNQLEAALQIKRNGNRPLGEILLEMKACAPSDIEDSLRLQASMRNPVFDGGLIGDLLVEQGRLRAEDLYEALRFQKAARQPLDALMVSMGIINQTQAQGFRTSFPHAVDAQGNINEDLFANALLQHGLATEHQVREAILVQKRGRALLGELLVALKFSTPEEIEQALYQQKAVRANVNKGPNKLGEILVQKNRVAPHKLEEATQVQKLARDKLGETLVSLGACTENDFEDALQIQFSWREKQKGTQDKLGDELIRDGHIDANKLASALEIHSRAGKPLGEILVEQGACTPEAVIDTLIRRDERRRTAFIEYLASHLPQQGGAGSGAPDARQPGTTESKSGLLGKVSSIFKKH